jgi:hypothetical protein
LLQRSRTREKIRVTMARLTGFARWSNIIRAELTGIAKTATWTGKQIRLAKLAGLAGLLGLAQTAARVDGQIRLVGLTGLAGLATRSRKKKVPVVLLTRKSRLRRIRST